MPGRSVTTASVCLRIAPSLRSTVTPGKLPTCWLAPVSWLNSVVLPQFWLPTSANVTRLALGQRMLVGLVVEPTALAEAGVRQRLLLVEEAPHARSAAAVGDGAHVLHLDPPRVVEAQRQLVAMDAHLHRVAHGRVLHHGHVDLRYDAHVQEVLTQRSLAADRDHRGRVPEGKVVQRAHVLVSSRRRRSPLADTVSHRLLSRTIVALLDGDGTEEVFLGERIAGVPDGTHAGSRQPAIGRCAPGRTPALARLGRSGERDGSRQDARSQARGRERRRPRHERGERRQVEVEHVARQAARRHRHGHEREQRRLRPSKGARAEEGVHHAEARARASR